MKNMFNIFDYELEANQKYRDSLQLQEYPWRFRTSQAGYESRRHDICLPPVLFHKIPLGSFSSSWPLFSSTIYVILPVNANAYPNPTMPSFPLHALPLLFLFCILTTTYPRALRF